ncbi:putative pyridoxal kinase [Diatrype stigma]|uniref:pyridoxal kinase n=1 Tax=Diatrype stigma TaxID=117547 RepID=A0AAN9V130_9PEZI
MGCDVSALNTVQFSNHTGYKQWKGTRVSAQEITDLWEGLKQSYLDNFDMMLSGYVPGAAAVEAVGCIAKELREKARAKKTDDQSPGRGSFFWVLDPVMGDNGRLYVAEDVVPAYRGLIPYADLILPNQFEAELLSEVKIHDQASLYRAIEVLHSRYGVPHVVITSLPLPLSLPPSPGEGEEPEQSRPPPTRTMSVVGSSMTSDRRPRPFRIPFSVFDCYFSGTGDMFAALMVTRMREAVHNTSTNNPDSGSAPDPRLEDVHSWLSPDGVDALDLPLARAAEKVLASMHEVLERTCAAMGAELRGAVRALKGKSDSADDLDPRTAHLLRSHAAELKLSRNLACLRNPGIRYHAEKM